MIVLKDLAREFDMDPHKVRAVLRSHMECPEGGRWRWHEDDKQLLKARKILSESGDD